MTETNYNYMYKEGHKPIKAWVKGVKMDDNAEQQLWNVARLPFIYSHVAVMPDVHWGMGATVGSVIPTQGAVIPAAVGVDIGCGMAAIKLDGISANELPESLAAIRHDIERTVPVGFNSHNNKHRNTLYDGIKNTGTVDPIAMLKFISEKHPELGKKRKQGMDLVMATQFGTLGGGNHFIELCLDESDDVWLMLHSGSRGIGNIIGSYFIELAKKDMRKHFINLPDNNLAYLSEGTDHYNDYRFAVSWAQAYAKENREAMLTNIVRSLRHHLPAFTIGKMAVNCHHNYVEHEHHFGQNVLVTRKGAVRAREGDLGIIPGSMGARSFIVRGKGNVDSFHSCSHGAGRVMSRKQAKREITVEEHKAATAGVECRKDEGMLDESPAAYKNIDDVMAAQSDLVDIVHTLKQVVCVKG